MAYRVAAICDEAGLLDLEPAWTALAAATPTGTIFASFAWGTAWWHHFGGHGQLYLIAVYEADGRLVGLAPLLRPASSAPRKLVFLGTGLADVGDILVAADAAASVSGAIFDYLSAHAGDWDLLDLDEIPPYSPLEPHWYGPAPAGLTVRTLPRTECPYIPLPATWEAYLAALSHTTRRQLVTKTQSFVTEHGASFRLVTTPAAVPAAVARFHALHLARWRVKEAPLDSAHRLPAFLPFLTDLCTRAASAGTLRLAELWAGDVSIAAWISFLVNGRWSGYMTGFDPAWSRYRPGKVLHSFVMQQAIAEGAHELDFGRGAEAYKYELGAVTRSNSRALLASSTLRSSLAMALAEVGIEGRAVLHRVHRAPAPPA